MAYQIKIWFHKNFISYGKAVYELKLLGFNDFSADQYLYAE